MFLAITRLVVGVESRMRACSTRNDEIYSMNVVSSLWKLYPVQDKYHRNELASDVKTDIILFPVHYFCSKNQLVALSDNFTLSYDSLKIAISFEVAARATPLTDCAATETPGEYACGYIRLCSIRLFSATTLATIV